MKLGKGHNLLGQMVFNSFTLSEAGNAFLESPHPLTLPVLDSNRGRLVVPTEPGKDEKPRRKGKGCQAIEGIRLLMSCREKWFTIASKEDYQFPGIFRSPYPRRLGYCPDITALPEYKCTTPNFLFEDIMFGKGKARNPQTTTMVVDGQEEQIHYRIVPCAGVKLCSHHTEGCSHVVSTREIKNQCHIHPEAKLVRSGDCPVEFIYIWPDDKSDTRRWLTGIKRGSENEENNVHNHPCHQATKWTKKMVSDLQEAVINNPLLKTSDLVVGKHFE